MIGAFFLTTYLGFHLRNRGIKTLTERQGYDIRYDVEALSTTFADIYGTVLSPGDAIGK